MAFLQKSPSLSIYICYIFLSFSIPTSASNITAVIPLISTSYGTGGYDVNVTLGQDQTFLLQVDTGSADTWVLGKEWQCVNELDNGTVIDADQSVCLSGNATFDYNGKNSGFELIPGQWLGDRYGSGNAYGVVGYEDLQIGAIEIKKQKIGVVNISSVVQDGVSVGLFALGYPSLGAVHPNSDSLNRTLYDGAGGSFGLLEHRIPYPTVFTRLIDNGMDGYISIALERGSLDKEFAFGGYLALGTLPPVHYGPFSSTGVEILKNVPLQLTNGKSEITEWLIEVQSVSHDDPKGVTHNFSAPFQVLVDTGNSYISLPPDLASSTNSAFNPPAKLAGTDEGNSVYSVACDSKPPAFSVEIGNRTFEVNKKDLISRNHDGACFSNIVGTLTEDGVMLKVLGDAFLQNVVAVFDMERDEMRFAQRLDKDRSSHFD